MKSGAEVYVVSIKLEGDKCAKINAVYEHESDAISDIKKMASEKMWEREKTYIDVIDSRHFEVKFLGNDDLVIASYNVDKSFLRCGACE